jgi:tetratricopeptide (TPR) repeat protein
VTAAGAVLCLLSLVLPVALWPGSTSYDPAKYLMWAWGAAAWLALAARAVALGRPTVGLPRGLVAAGATMLLVQASALGHAASPHLVARALLWSALWWLVVIGVTAIAREERQKLRLVACAAAGVAMTCVVALFQIAGVLPAPASGYVPAGIGTLGNENSVAELAAALLLPSLLLPLSTRGRVHRAVGVLPSLVMSAVLLASGATGARVAALAAATFALCGEAMLRSRRPDRAPLLLGALVAAGIIAAVILVEQVQAGGPLAMNRDLPTARFLAANHGPERRADWLVARELWNRHPWTGCGAGNYGVLWPHTRARLAAAGGFAAPAGGAPVATRAHNEYLQWAAETGWLGVAWLATVVVAGFGSWARGWRTASTRHQRRALLLAAAGVVAIAVAALAGFPAHMPASGFALALLVGLARSSAPGTSGCVRWPRWCAVPLLAGGLLLAAGVSRVFHGDLLLERGSRQFSSGAYARSIESLEAGIARVPWPGQARLELGMALAATGHLPEAATMLEASLRDRPSFEAPLALAEIELDAGQPVRAAAWLELVDLCAPPLPQRRQVAYLRAYAHLRAGDPLSARDAFAVLAAQDRLDHRAWLGLGYADDLLGDRAAAAAAYRQAIAVIEESVAMPRAGTVVAHGEVVRLRAHLASARRALESVTSSTPGSAVTDIAPSPGATPSALPHDRPHHRQRRRRLRQRQRQQSGHFLRPQLQCRGRVRREPAGAQRVLVRLRLRLAIVHGVRGEQHAHAGAAALQHGVLEAVDAVQHDIQVRLLPHLAERRLEQRLARLHASGRQVPAAAVVPFLDQEELVATPHQHQGVEPGRHRLASRAAPSRPSRHSGSPSSSTTVSSAPAAAHAARITARYGAMSGAWSGDAVWYSTAATSSARRSCATRAAMASTSRASRRWSYQGMGASAASRPNRPERMCRGVPFASPLHLSARRRSLR